MNDRPGLEGKSAKSLIEESARAFDAELHTPAYVETHSDAAQLDWLVSALCVATPHRVLDLGTGNGYVAMEAAKRLPGSSVVGLDVAAGAIDKNNSTVVSSGITNVAFQVCDGISLPFQDNWFEGAACRYAFHHMPKPDETLSEISRVLHHRGRFVFADAVRDNHDGVDFINAFQQLKHDGHVEIRRSDELLSMLQCHGFQLENHFETSLTFDRTRTEEYDALVESTPKTVLDTYKLSVENHRIVLTFPIFNAVFTNNPAV